MPAVLALDAVNQVSIGSKQTKNTLISNRSIEDADNQNVEYTLLLYKYGVSLMNKIKNILPDCVRFMYEPASLIKVEDIFADDYLIFSTYTKPRFNVDSIKEDFVVPICKIDKIVLDIAGTCKLTMEQYMQLSKNMSKYILNSTYRENDLRKKYGNNVVDIVKVFRELAKPHVYCNAKSITDILEQALKEEKYGKIDMFKDIRFCLYKPLEDESDERQLKIKVDRFIQRYFTYTNIYDYMFYKAFPYNVTYYKNKSTHKYYNKLFKDFLDNVLSTFLKNLKGIITKEYKEGYVDKYKTLPNQYKNDLFKTFTIESSIDFVYSQLKKRPSNFSEIRDVVKKYIEQNNIESKMRMLNLDKNDVNVALLYKYIVKNTFNIVGLYAIEILQNCQNFRNDSLVYNSDDK